MHSKCPMASTVAHLGCLPGGRTQTSISEKFELLAVLLG